MGALTSAQTTLQRLARNPMSASGGVLLLAIVAIALAAPIIMPVDPMRIVGPPLIWPFKDPHYVLGTDALGRSILPMILYGARTTLLIGVSAAAASLVIGVVVGAVAGYYGGWVGALCARVIELFQTIPGLIFIMVVVSFFGANMVYVVLAIGFASWPAIARLTRAEFMAWRGRDFVVACRAMGMSDARLIFGEILPNALVPVIALSSLSIAGAILVESALSFLGVADPTVASWGRLVGDGRDMLRTDWYICALPGAAIVLTVVALSLLSDGMNDVLNPRTRNR
jgi:peptide/nickel transport system permease protein